MLDSDDEGKRLAAARALFSYGPARPPADEDEAPSADLVSALVAILHKLERLPEHRFAALLTEGAETLLCRVSQRTSQVNDAAARFMLDVERAVER